MQRFTQNSTLQQEYSGILILLVVYTIYLQYNIAQCGLKYPRVETNTTQIYLHQK
mgnify:CR=1 FL=1